MEIFHSLMEKFASFFRLLMTGMALLYYMNILENRKYSKSVLRKILTSFMI